MEQCYPVRVDELVRRSSGYYATGPYGPAKGIGFHVMPRDQGERRPT